MQKKKKKNEVRYNAMVKDAHLLVYFYSSDALKCIIFTERVCTIDTPNSYNTECKLKNFELKLLKHYF